MRIRPALLMTIAALAAGGLTLAAAPAPAWAKDPAKDAAKEAKEAEALKVKRDAFRKKQKDAGKHPFLDLAYAADPVKVKDTRWSQSDGPHGSSTEETGIQLSATWSASAQQQGGITVVIQKFIHKKDNSEYSLPFELAGKKPKCSDLGGMVEGFYLEWLKQMTDIREAKCKEPKKSNVGPASLAASVYGTNKEAQKPERRDVYGWLAPNTTYIATVTFSDKYLDDPAILTKAEEYIDSIKELKAPN